MIAPPAAPASDGSPEEFRRRVGRLGLYGVLSRWEEVGEQPWLRTLVELEETERQRRGLERRIRDAHIGRFKPMADFDWAWPKKIDRDLIEDLFSLEFLRDGANVILMGPNGIGKSMIAQNLVHHAVLRGHAARFVTASDLLNELAAQESSSSLSRRLRRYCQPSLLAVDEVGYLSYDSRHADLLFEIVSRRYQHKSTIVTTNKVFKEWNTVFPNAGSVVALVDRLTHRGEIVELDGESYRLKEAEERKARLAAERRARRGQRPPQKPSPKAR